MIQLDLLGYNRPGVKNRTSLLLPLLSLLALASLLANLLLLRRSQQLLRRWREVLLDPLGLQAFAMQPTAPASSSAGRLVVFFGDSRAAAWSAPTIPGYRFLNRGVNGESSAQALGRLATHLAPLNPDLVVLQVGVNDLWSSVYLPDQRQVIASQVQTNLQKIVAELRQLPSQVILVTIFPLGRLDPWQRLTGWQTVQEDILAVNGYLKGLGGEGVVILDASAVLAGADGYVQPHFSLDALHLTDAGYAALNEALRNILTEAP